MFEKIKQKLDQIPIFFEEEKTYILNKINWKQEDFLKMIYEELLNIEKHVEQDKDILVKEVKKIEDKTIIEIEAKKREIIRKMIQEAEKNDD